MVKVVTWWLAVVIAPLPVLTAQEVGRTQDTLRPIVTVAPNFVSQSSQRKPPLTPARAFLTSLVVPGLAQARFDRGSAGALFVAVEVGALAMIKRSGDQLKEARSFRNDSIPDDFSVGPDGNLVATGLSSGGFNSDLVRRRRLHLEDWIAVVAFNHLLSGADAFVSAQLWDLPTAVSVYPTAGRGAVFVATIKW